MKQTTAGPHAHRRVGRAAVANVVLAVLVAGCSGASDGSQGDRTAGSTGSTSPVAFSECIRSHGVVNFPDPNGDGTIPKVSPLQLGVSDSRFQEAQQSCANLLLPSNNQTHQTLSGMRVFAQCIRAHGVHEWPDPTTDDQGQPVFDLHSQIRPDSQQIDTVSGDCAHLLHPAPGQNGAILCNGIGEAGCHHYG